MAVYDPLWKLTSSRVAWTWNASYQSLFVKAKLLIKADVCMKFYDESKPRYLKTDASRVGLGAALLQTQDGMMCQKDTVSDNTILWPIAFASKSLTSAECRYSNIGREALGMLHRLKKSHHYGFVRDVTVITDHKPLLAIFKKRCSNPVTMNPANTFENLSIQGPNSIQTRVQNLYCRLAVPWQP